LTVNRLGLPVELRRVFSSTNMIESCFSRAGDLCRNVKWWRDANMAWRWGGTVLLEAERGLHRIHGYRQIPLLVEALLKGIDCQEAVVTGLSRILSGSGNLFKCRKGIHLSELFKRNVILGTRSITDDFAARFWPYSCSGICMRWTGFPRLRMTPRSL
jgi:hypothetical protein